MSTASAKLMTAEEFYDYCHRPENRDRNLELERGEVVELSHPGIQHGVPCGNVGFVLNSYVRQRRRGYVCTNDTGIIWERDPDSVRGPDVILFDENRRFDDLEVKYSDRPPKLVVEVRSPNDRWSKTQRRITRFLQQGVAVVWFVDPEERTVTVYQSHQLPQVVEENEELTGGDELPEFRCRVSDFFQMPGE